jgi:molybdenum cofactor cytidylyltransferase
MPETARGAGLIPAVHILVLAAGASSRMNGQDKLLLPAGGTPLLRKVVTVAVATGAPVYVALPAESAARHAAIADLPVQTITIPDAVQGLSRTISRGAAAISIHALGAEDGLMILPADMPDFDPMALSDLIARFRAQPDLIFRGGTVSGQPGHPVILPRDLWPELASLTGDEGGRPLLQKYQGRVRVAPLPGQMAILDLDTPAEWAAWRNRNS